jgi:bifunctional non-homologous end joining protein LigD
MLAEKRIPPGRFGAGPMIVWDHGKYGPYPTDASVHEKPLREGFNEGRLKLVLHGVRLHGAWALELHGKEWAFKKLDDRFASDTQPDWDHRSVLSNKSLSDVEQEWRRRMGIE